ncbi:MAG TPA: SsgA family sporulation/cell division regulator [Pseudonocardiaceae bacterium]|jgi:hypothetical protein|nr:SsgA family sporulation/cell division regulator [Pseudonocardiaceae bacterium]
MSTNTIHHEQIAALYGTQTPIQTRWSYDSAEPFAVTVAFCAERGRWVEWIFSRDLLIEGLSEPAGLGDLRVRPGEDTETLVLEIHSPSGEATFELDLDATEDFLQTTLELVPAGTEVDHFDVERLINDLTGI